MHTNFQKAFQEGYVIQCDTPTYGPQTMTISIVDIGDLVLSSGKVVVQDPGNPTSLRYLLQRRVEPGKYPVSLSLCYCTPAKRCVIACAKIQINDSNPVRWEVAVSDNTQYLCHTYDVDSGTACFMDFEAALFLKQVAFPHQQTDIVYSIDDSYQKYRDDYIQEEFIKEIVIKMSGSKESVAARTSYQVQRRWSNFFLGEMTIFNEISRGNGVRKPDTNIVVFDAGWGDGEDYHSYWGFDKDDQVCCLVTDFFIFFEKYLEYGEFHERPDIVCDNDS